MKSYDADAAHIQQLALQQVNSLSFFFEAHEQERTKKGAQNAWMKAIIQSIISQSQHQILIFN